MDKNLRISMQQHIPHTFNAMQSLVMAMEAAYKSKGKRTLFGRDKEAEAQVKFYTALRGTLISLVLDGVLMESDSNEKALESIREVIKFFSSAYPNWPAAYKFAYEFFGYTNKTNSLAIIGRLRN